MAPKKLHQVLALLLSALLLCTPVFPVTAAAADATCPNSPTGEHNPGPWRNDGTHHWRFCTFCYEELLREPHTDGPKCTVCDYVKPNDDCDHTFVIQERTSAITHREVCTKCGWARSVNCTQSTFVKERGSCLNNWYCECGNVHAERYWEHNYVWEINATTHTRKCTNPGCTVEETAPHTYLPTTDCTAPVSCSVCGMVNGQPLHTEHNWSSWINTGSGTHYRYCMNAGCAVRQSETHTPAPNDDRTKPTVCEDCGAIIEEALPDHHWGAWTSNASGGHSRSCLDAGCTAKQGALHTGGTATCTTPAQCADCGAYYGEKNPSNHAGGTEIRNAKPATAEEAGYTGDTVCLGCGEVLKEGEEIPVLDSEEVHEHAFGEEYKSDSVRHWKECACGEKSEAAEHTFENSTCTVCGAADPNYVPEKGDHVHTFQYNQWEHNAEQHWRICKDCGAVVEPTDHTYDYSISYNETGHWFNCVCGESVFGEHDFDEETHTCKECHMMDPEYVPEWPDWPELPDPGEPYYLDVDTDVIYFESVQKASAYGIMQGTGDGNFEPDGTFTRGQLATLMYNMAHKPQIAVTSDFTDVQDGAWYADAVNWASAIGLVHGTGDGTFRPGENTGRETVALILYNYAGIVGLSQAYDEDALADFADADQIPDWALTAMKWAVSNGIFVPDEDGMLNPKTAATRAEVAMFSVAFLEGNSSK